MLTDQQWKEFDKVCNGEVYTQVEDAGAEAMLKGVRLAWDILMVLNGDMSEAAMPALDYFYTFANWRKLRIHENYWHWCMVENYGEEEANYLINKEGWKPGNPGKKGD